MNGSMTCSQLRPLSGREKPLLRFDEIRRKQRSDCPHPFFVSHSLLNICLNYQHDLRFQSHQDHPHDNQMQMKHANVYYMNTKNIVNSE